MKKTGIIRHWDAAKGFGFIRSQDVSADVFFHIKVFRSSANTLPHEGLHVYFEEIHVGGKGPKATIVDPLYDVGPAKNSLLAALPSVSHVTNGPPRMRARSRPVAKIHSPVSSSSAQNLLQKLSIFLLALTVWLGLIIFGLYSQRLVIWSLAALIILNIATIFVYAFDKNAAERGWWRTKEDSLHFVALAGGWPAAWLAQHVLRHKTGKQSFQSAYWVTVWLNCAALAAWIFWLFDKISVPFAPRL